MPQTRDMRRPDEIVSERMRVPGRQSDVAVDRVLARFVRSARQADALDLDRRELVSTWTWVLYSPDDDGTFWLTTDGLQRYGLPELSLHGIPAGHINDGRSQGHGRGAAYSDWVD